MTDPMKPPNPLRTHVATNNRNGMARSGGMIVLINSYAGGDERWPAQSDPAGLEARVAVRRRGDEPHSHLALTLFVVFEKLAPVGVWGARVSGLLLIATAAWMLAHR